MLAVAAPPSHGAALNPAALFFSPLRAAVIDFGRQHVITQDTVQIDIDALVYFRVTDPRVAVFQIQNLPDAIELLTQATLRNIIALMTLDDTFSSREAINAELLSKVGSAATAGDVVCLGTHTLSLTHTRTLPQIQRDAERWGVLITRVEIFNIEPPPKIRVAMEKQIQVSIPPRPTPLSLLLLLLPPPHTTLLAILLHRPSVSAAVLCCVLMASARLL